MKSSIPLLLSALLCLGAGDPPKPVDSELPLVELGAIREDRSHQIGKQVRFVFQLKVEVEKWQPWVTRFGAEEFRAFSVWGDSAHLWTAADYADSTPRIFARRGSQPAKMLLTGRKYDRFEVRAVVRTVFLDEPWIELLEVRRLQEKVSQGTVLHGERAIGLMADQNYELALGELARARVGLLPDNADLELRRLIERCQTALIAD